jgi:hypothetical protein
MKAVLYTYDKAYGIEGETYAEVHRRYKDALTREDPVFEFNSRTQAFRGPIPVTIPLTAVTRIEAE